MQTSSKRTSKVVTLQQAVGMIKNGMTISLGGGPASESPNAFVRELLRQGTKDLTLVPLNGTGYQTDILLGAGRIKTLYTSYVGLDYIGTAPNYRKLAEAGKLDIVELDEMGLLRGLKASAAGVAFFPLPDGFRATSHPKDNPDFFKEIDDPFTGKKVVVVPPLSPDIAVIHVAKCDPYGNARYSGWMEDLLPEAAKQTIVTTDEIVSLEDTRAHYKEVNILGKLVVAVVNVPYGAHPAQCSGCYQHDEAHLKEYQKAARDEKTFKEYLDKYVYGPKNHEEYLERIGISRLLSLKYY